MFASRRFTNTSERRTRIAETDRTFESHAGGIGFGEVDLVERPLFEGLERGRCVDMQDRVELLRQAGTEVAG